MNFKINKFSPLIIISIGIYALTAGNLIPSATNFYSPILPKEALDTVIPIKSIYPIDTSDPIRLKLPPDIEQGYHFDPESNSYIFSNKLGNEYIDAPMGMTFSEFLKEKAKEQESSYFAKLAGISDGRGSGKAKDPLEGYKTSTSIITRLFGSDVIDIKPAGSVDIDLGLSSNHTFNPTATERQRKYTTFVFQPTINLSIAGKVGEKLSINANYNTQSTLDFDQFIKIKFDGGKGNEDDILKNIEAGNVSLPLRSSLIQGSQALFGIKADLQFGHLKITGLVSQQKSERKNLQLQGGSQLQTFSVPIDHYDENKHFLLSHYNRSVFNSALKTMPQINSFFDITDIEVWVTNDRQETEDVRDIVALADLGEWKNLTTYNPLINDTLTVQHSDYTGRIELPNNDANGLYKHLVADAANTRPLNKVVSTLESSPLNLTQTKDFEKVRARKLRKDIDYTFHPQLGFISVNVGLRPDQVLAVSYRYRYNDKIYQVGEFSHDAPVDPNDPNVLFVKLLKATTQKTEVPLWNLMMKNIYSVGAYQTNALDFRLDVFYEDPGYGQKRFLPDTDLKGQPLLRVFNLDNLNTTGDPQPDGVFDFVEGVTINSRTGRVMFPVLEPFGADLAKKINNPVLAERYTYPDLYTNTITRAREYPEKNRFTLKGSYKSTVSSEISLGAFNVPQGSVRVTAGGTQLVEGQDYTIDYSAGKVTIINDAYLTSGVPVNVSFEDNALFSFQQKSMMGIRADYALNKNINLGATFMRLSERPYTQKVNVGDDPLNNKIYGVDLNFTKDADWLTRLVDKLPLIQTKEPSKVNLTTEVAVIQPGHSKYINNLADEGGTAYIDDFEGSTSSFDLRTPTQDWFISSVPQNDNENNNPRFKEATLSDNLAYGANRAQLNWFRAEVNALNKDDVNDPYTRFINITEVFKRRNNVVGINNGLYTFDVVYSPSERGPYNYELPEGYPGFSAGLTSAGQLREPQTRWAGIQRAITNSDFEAQNYEFIEFYMLSPFQARPNGVQNTSSGKLYINLGNVSEDVLRDSRNFFENGLPGPKDENQKVFTSAWGKVPAVNQFINAFDNDLETREAQDVGLDGLSTAQEKEHFADYLKIINESPLLSADAKAMIERDPSNDDFVHFRQFPDDAPILERYRYFNGQEGNSKPTESNASVQSASTNYPDREDINNDNSLNESEAYYQYEIPIEYDGQDGIKPNAFITDIIQGNGNDKWYRFKVPINQPTQTIGGLSDFRSIRFMRMYFTGFEQQTIMRFARMDLVRNQWRKYTRGITGAIDEPIIIQPPFSDLKFDLNAVNFEDNSAKIPINYVLPKGLRLERAVGAYQETFQNEQSLALNFCNLPEDSRIGIYKNTSLDMRRYKRLKMFVHAGPISDEAEKIPDGDLSVFMRIGSDYTDNYYEYEIPLKMSDLDYLNSVKNDLLVYSEGVWLADNAFDFPLHLFTDLKEERNKVDGVGTYYSKNDPEKPNNTVTVKGNPNMGYIKGVMIGIRNKQGGVPRCAEIWINELRMTGFDERGGMAAISRLDLQLADLGTVTLSGAYSSLGWGGLDQRVQQRAIESNYQYDISTNLELGKFIPGKTGIKIPFYYQYTTNVKTPEYDPYDLDIKLRDKLDTYSGSERDSLREQAIEYQNITSYSFNNVRKERTNKAATPMPWDIENFSFTYGHSRTKRTDPIIAQDQTDQYKGGFDYNFTMRPLYVTPFAKAIKKDKYLKFVTDFNFNPLPNTFSFNTQLNRMYSTKLYRFTDPFQSTWRTRNFLWDRNYMLSWDITKSLKFDFNATNTAVIDELSDRFIDTGLPDPSFNSRVNKAEIWDNIKDLGRNKNYKHTFNINYNVPFKNLPMLEWISMRALYGGTYTWSSAAKNVDTLGNVIQNTQIRQLNADLSFDRLYSKSNYLKKIQKPGSEKKKDAKTNQKTSSNDKKPVSDDKLSTVQQDSTTTKLSKAEKAKLKKEKEKEKRKLAREERRKNREPSLAERILIRPLLSVRKARLTYTENLNSTIPGYMPGTTAMGMDQWSSPGFGYVAGWQPDDNYFERAIAPDNNWITKNIFQNQLVILGQSQNIDARVNLEPFNDLKVDLNAGRTYQNTHTELFKVKAAGEGFGRYTGRDIGSYTTTYFTLNTFFDDLDDVFDRFENNRTTISSRLGVTPDPNVPGYTTGFGKVQQDVLIPAFLSAYSNTNPNKQDLDVFNTFPKINWQLTYNGLTKIEFFKKFFSSVNVTHAYKSTLSVNSFNTSPNYDDADPFKFNPITNNYYSRLEIPAVSITEGLSPLIRFDFKTKSDITFNIDYKKLRNLSLSFVDNMVNETKSADITVGAGYTLHNVKMPFMKEFQMKKNKKKKAQNTKDPGKTSSGPGPKGGNKTSENDLIIKVDVSYRDDATVSHFIDQDLTRTSRGATTLRIAPNIEYQYNKNLTLRLFYDYNLTNPKTSQQFKTISQRGGITFRFLLN
jgi:cell surface protein SprA